MSPTIETIVSADIGGTNSRLELHEVNRTVVEATAGTSKKGWIKGTRAPGTLVLKKTYQNHEFKSFEAVLHAFLREANAKAPVTACFAVAGPVRNNAAQLTNRNWNINGDSIAQEFSIRRVLLVNDFVALGYGLLTLDEAKECVCLQDAPKQPDAPIACIGAGTGLGQCFLTPVPGEDDLFADAAQGGEGGATVGYTCFPSEGGHAEFAPRNDLEFDLLNFLMRKFEQKHRVSVERVVSGTGLVNVYEVRLL
jgi:glucokinase